MAAAPGIRLHRRTMDVERASANLRILIENFQHERKLTNIEMAKILTEALQSRLTMALRTERHPRNPGKKADEE